MARSRRLGELVITDDVPDHRRTLRLAGELDLANTPALESTIRRIRAEGERDLILDLRDLSFIDSSGLQCLVSATEACWEVGCVLRLSLPQAQVKRVLEVSGTTSQLNFIEPVD